MPKFLILKLHGPMQAWGTHTYEDFRPANLFPTRSGLLGLLGACLGIDRKDGDGLERLASSVEFAVRSDRPGLKMADYHTILDGRRANRTPKEGETIQSRREYLYDAEFTVAVGAAPNAAIALDAIAEAVRRPCYTPVLGRRSCALGRPLFEGWQEAADVKAALDQVPGGGPVYAESPAWGDARPIPVRDVPMRGDHRRFASRQVYLLGREEA